MATFYLRQLLVGRDVGKRSVVGRQMQNFVYLVGDRDAKRCIAIDPAWDVKGVLDVARADDMQVVGALCTHYHPDHVGGRLFGFGIAGLSGCSRKNPCKVHAHRLEGDGLRKVTESAKRPRSPTRATRSRSARSNQWLTPGHTPGSSCFRVKDALLGRYAVSQGCGRVDLPGSDRGDAPHSEPAPGDPSGRIVLYPGHAYGGEHAPLSEVRRINPVFPPRD
jgi:glyoxylase-like metal-dependent hydrolase (beta-lactamase superfamily II)